MDQENATEWYQVELRPRAGMTHYLFDLSFDRLLREIVIPRETGGSIMLGGSEKPISEYKPMIVLTAEPVMPRLEAWAPSYTGSDLLLARKKFVEEEKIFLTAPDMTNQLLHDFREALDWGGVPILMEALRDAEASDNPEDAARSSAIREQIAGLVGTFVGKTLKAMNT